MRLKDYLEATGLIDERDLVDAENRAQIYGGSLDTALLELEVLEPVRLDAALAAARGLLSSPPELLLLAPKRRPWEMLPEIWIDEREAVPLAFIEDRLWVALHPDVTEEAIASVQHRLPGAALTVTAECWIWTIADQYRRTPTPPRYSLLAAGYVRAILSARQAIAEESLTADVAGVHENLRDDGFHITDDDDETPVSSDMSEETGEIDARAADEAAHDAGTSARGEADDEAPAETAPETGAADVAAEAPVDAATQADAETEPLASDAAPPSAADEASSDVAASESAGAATSPAPAPVIPGLRRGVPSPAEPAPRPKPTHGELPPFIPPPR